MGFLAKKNFTTQIDEKTLVLLSLYFFQPILIVWGLTRAPIDYEFIMSPFFYLVSLFVTLSMMIFYAKIIFNSKADERIYLATALIGNTGNLGIPLGIALFGVESVPYTSIINIANVFFMYTISVYFSKYICDALDMVVYTSLTIQLFIFGIYLYSVKLKTIPWKLSLQISLAKHIVLPIIGIIIVLNFTTLNAFVA